MKLSLVMPARNEEGCIIQTLERFTDVLASNVRDFEIVDMRFPLLADVVLHGRLL